MNEQEKSLKLAVMMGWRIINNNTAFLFDSGLQPIMPYDTGATGLAQFAAILLKFPEVMLVWQRYLDEKGSMAFLKEPTQANILDAILKMSGIEI